MDTGFCTACGARVPDGASFCGACGTAVKAAAPAEASAPPPVTPVEAAPAGAATPAQPAPAPPAAIPPAPVAMATPAYAAPPPTPAANPPWGRILSVLLGVGLLIFAGIKMYHAFYGGSGSSATQQIEDRIRQELTAGGQQVSEVHMTAMGADRMTGYAMFSRPGVPGSQIRTECTATRQSGTYFTYQCAPAGYGSASPAMTPTPSSTPPLGTPAPYGAPAPTAMTPERRAALLAECSREQPPALCGCAVDRIAVGTPSIQAVRECAAMLGMPPPR